MKRPHTKMALHILILLVVAISFSKAQNGQAPLEKCWVTNPPLINILSDELSPKDTFALIIFNIKNQLHRDRVFVKPSHDLEWRVPIIEKIAKITKKICPVEFVTKKYINVIKNMMIIYYESIKYKYGNLKYWEAVHDKLDSCLNSTTLIPYTYEAYAERIARYNVDGEKEPTLIKPLGEALDAPNMGPTDVFIDSFWFMYSITAGACFPKIKKAKMNWITEFHYNFVQDFLRKLFVRWSYPGNTNFGSIVGDMDIQKSLFNLKACAAAIYKVNRIPHLYPARPIYLGFDEQTHTFHDMNFKTGSNLL